MKKIRKIILEQFLQEDEFRFEKERGEAKQVLFAFMEGKTKVNSVEDSKEKDISDAMSDNDFSHHGISFSSEEPIISLTYNHKDYSISASIEKEYQYKTEDSTMDFPGHEEINLKNIEIKNNQIVIYNEFGFETIFTKAELGKDTFTKIEKTLMKYVK